MLVINLLWSFFTLLQPKQSQLVSKASYALWISFCLWRFTCLADLNDIIPNCTGKTEKRSHCSGLLPASLHWADAIDETHQIKTLTQQGRYCKHIKVSPCFASRFMYHWCSLSHAVTELLQFSAPKPATFWVSLLSLPLLGFIFPAQHPPKKARDQVPI